MENTIAPSRWYRLIPIAFITYSLAYLDRAKMLEAQAKVVKRAQPVDITKEIPDELNVILIIRQSHEPKTSPFDLISPPEPEKRADILQRMRAGTENRFAKAMLFRRSAGS